MKGDVAECMAAIDLKAEREWLNAAVAADNGLDSEGRKRALDLRTRLQRVVDAITEAY